jgi:hypothetical protein
MTHLLDGALKETYLSRRRIEARCGTSKGKVRVIDAGHTYGLLHQLGIQYVGKANSIELLQRETARAGMKDSKESDSKLWSRKSYVWCAGR